MRLKSRHWQDHAMLSSSAKLTFVIAVKPFGNPNSLHLRVFLQSHLLDGSPNGLTAQTFSSFKHLKVAAACLLDRFATQHQSDRIGDDSMCSGSM